MCVSVVARISFYLLCFYFLFFCSSSSSSFFFILFPSEFGCSHWWVCTDRCARSLTLLRTRCRIVYGILYTTLAMVIENIEFFTYNSIIYVVRFLFVAPSFICWWICVVNLSILVSWRFFALSLSSFFLVFCLGDFITLQSYFSFFFIHSHCYCPLYCCIDEGFYLHYIIMR